MDSLIHQIGRFTNQVMNSTGNVNNETWIVMSLIVVLVGYFLLRGDPR